MEVLGSLASLLDSFMKRADIGDTRLASQVNSIAGNAYFIHRSTIRNWRDGSSQKVNNWRQLVAVAAVLNLNESETNNLLESGGCPPLSVLSITTDDADHHLFKFWFSEPIQQTKLSDSSAAEGANLEKHESSNSANTTASPIKPKPGILSRKTVAIGAMLVALFATGFWLYPFNKLTLVSGNILINSGFSDGTAEWQSYVNDVAVASFNIDSEIMRIQIDQPGGNHWHIQLFQQGLSVKAGETYTVRFKVRGDENTSMKADVTRAIDPKTSLGFDNSARQAITISNKWTIRTIEFEATESISVNDGGARVLFDIGRSAPGSIEIDDIEFFKGKR